MKRLQQNPGEAIKRQTYSSHTQGKQATYYAADNKDDRDDSVSDLQYHQPNIGVLVEMTYVVDFLEAR